MGFGVLLLMLWLFSGERKSIKSLSDSVCISSVTHNLQRYKVAQRQWAGLESDNLKDPVRDRC